MLALLVLWRINETQLVLDRNNLIVLICRQRIFTAPTGRIDEVTNRK
jgi:hypothetical protein